MTQSQAATICTLRCCQTPNLLSTLPPELISTIFEAGNLEPLVSWNFEIQRNGSSLQHHHHPSMPYQFIGDVVRTEYNSTRQYGHDCAFTVRTFRVEYQKYYPIARHFGEWSYLVAQYLPYILKIWITDLKCQPGVVPSYIEANASFYRPHRKWRSIDVKTGTSCDSMLDELFAQDKMKEWLAEIDRNVK